MLVCSCYILSQHIVILSYPAIAQGMAFAVSISEDTLASSNGGDVWKYGEQLTSNSKKLKFFEFERLLIQRRTREYQCANIPGEITIRTKINLLNLKLYCLNRLLANFSVSQLEVYDIVHLLDCSTFDTEEDENDRVRDGEFVLSWNIHFSSSHSSSLHTIYCPRVLPYHCLDPPQAKTSKPKRYT